MVIFSQKQHYIFFLEFQEEAKFSLEPVSKPSTSPCLQTITDNSHSEVQEKKITGSRNIYVHTLEMHPSL